MALSEQQCAFFETFGFLVFRGMVAEDLPWINEGFAEIFANREHDGTRRTTAGTDTSEKLCRLLDHPKVLEVATSLLGDDFNYLGGDANFYVGDTWWHSDGWHDIGQFVKMAFYLDPVGPDTGCLRVIPGSHSIGNDWVDRVRRVGQAEAKLGIPPHEVPAFALESHPGDVVVFNHNLQHAAFGGNSRRRMFTLNLSRRAESAAEVQELRNFINSNARFWVPQSHSDVMRQTASPARMRHLAQVIENEDELPEMVRQAKLTMSEPANG